MKFSNKLILTIGLVCSLTACSPNKTSEEYIQSAKTHIANGKSSAAILELKNAISIELENPESRLLLGTLYLEFGDVEAAEKELRRSLELNGDAEVILPKLFKALNLQNKSEEVLTLANQSRMSQGTVLPEILLYKTLAYLKLGDKKKAEETIVQASENSSESVYSQLGEAYLMAESTNQSGALGLIESILIKTPELTEALLLKGQLLFIDGDYVSAIDAFNEYHRLLPKNIQIRLFLANSYIRNDQYSEANEHLDFLLKILPEHPFINQLKGLVYYRGSDYENALIHTDKAIQNGLNVPSNRIIAGLSAFKLEQYERSYHLLIAITGSLPVAHPVRKVLAVVQLQLGYSSEAGETLQIMDGATVDDINLLTAASFELLKAGKFQEAGELVEKTSEMNITNPQDIVKIGILKLSMNDLEGIADLEKASEIAPDLPLAKLALASAYIQNKAYDKALAIAEKWKVEDPDKTEGYNLAATIYLLTKEIESAEIEFNFALTVDKGNSQSLLYFANKALKNKDSAESIKFLDVLLSTFPNNIKALTLNYRAHKELSTIDSAIDKIANSFSENKDSIAHRLLYSRVLFIDEKFNEVITLLKALKVDSTTTPLHWSLLGSSYLKLNENEKALTIYDDWIKFQPQYRTAWLKKVATQEKLADYGGALSTVEKVLETFPKDGQFNILRASYLILTEQFNIAQIQIDSLTEEQIKLPFVRGLQGKIWFTEGKYQQALPGIEALYELLPSSYNASLLFSLHKKLKQEKSAFEFMKEHVASYPNDLINKNLLAEIAINFDLLLSKEYYLVLLEQSPDDLLILNNLAWVEYKLGYFEPADIYAMRALDLNKNHPQLFDTAALIKLALGQKAIAIELLTKAKQLAPNDTEILKHLEDATAQ
ncbi:MULTISPECIES: XrtA/PEP-CTERM system TPR-repeat protein PrsT [unclassified Colwellia]|uniref:XrtA/PEP-CTERM system TPR-repeat protein PrsT n=1 Tax=unclassified Colwellia TaxID=196834 RepID=UPI0015F47B7A|nr:MULTISPECIES: XrtA/PEP-CTERM system TPR-repeat protein PrsT [unclassified Colwellia]MBA6358011.1 PEP-CTERM system TPR-repeat protein PrsT [Colwellia sp. BRX8-3]MBA6361906.1 PEP-CTERM system TPR-repeat protein PrsT [Colwellia sp. BRX8-6]MBA6369133.1 PEP-CTERM system TPR-repeat protein PrsT [Colwellia sp. BRX8-5]MBA6374920.1 PEP-CTERM system TPR-repeat protein PrsT [Colwellia sp. BRX8-2]